MERYNGFFSKSKKNKEDKEQQEKQQIEDGISRCPNCGKISEYLVSQELDAETMKPVKKSVDDYQYCKKCGLYSGGKIYLSGLPEKQASLYAASHLGRLQWWKRERKNVPEKEKWHAISYLLEKTRKHYPDYYKGKFEDYLYLYLTRKTNKRQWDNEKDKKLCQCCGKDELIAYGLLFESEIGLCFDCGIYVAKEDEYQLCFSRGNEGIYELYDYFIWSANISSKISDLIKQKESPLYLSGEELKNWWLNEAKKIDPNLYEKTKFEDFFSAAWKWSGY